VNTVGVVTDPIVAAEVDIYVRFGSCFRTQTSSVVSLPASSVSSVRLPWRYSSAYLCY
jgi:hypothetical protein